MFSALAPHPAPENSVRLHPDCESPAQAFSTGCQHPAVLRKLAASESLWIEGETRSHIFIVRSGAICLSRILPDGRRIVFGFAYRGDIIGIGSDVHVSDAQALQFSRLEAIPVAVFKRAMIADPALRKRATASVNQALIAAYQHIVVLSKLSATERLAGFLISLSDRNEKYALSRMSVVLPMRRSDIADHLGLTIETVSRTFTIFRNAGLIALDQSNVVFFTDISKLRALAAGDTSAIQ